MTDQEIRKMFDQFLVNNGFAIAPIGKSIVSLDEANFGNIMPRSAVLPLINLARKQNMWLDAIDTKVVTGKAGSVPILDVEDANLQPVGENDPQGGDNAAITARRDYRTQKYLAKITITFDDLREASHAGIEGFEDNVYANFGIGLGNSLANLAYNADKSLPATSPTNKMLRKLDGIRKQVVAGATVVDVAGRPFRSTIFSAIDDRMPDRFAGRPELRWFYNSRIQNRWRESLTNVHTSGGSQGSALGDAALVTEDVLKPLGRDRLLVPQISDRQGPTPIAPTSAAASGNGITFVLTTLVDAEYVASAAAGKDRWYTVTHKTTGKSERVQGFVDTTLQITTVGKLGQTAVSTTASDYEVTLSDETDIILAHPKSFTLVLNGEWRWFTQFEPSHDRWVTYVYIDTDILLAVPEMVVMFQRVSIPASDYFVDAA